MHCRETANDVRAKFIVEAANHPTDPVADEVPKRLVCTLATTFLGHFLVLYSLTLETSVYRSWRRKE